MLSQLSLIERYVCGTPEKMRWEVGREEGSNPECLLWLIDTEQSLLELALWAAHGDL